MAAIVFPDSPLDGDTYVAQNGALYTYNSEDDSWTGRIKIDQNIAFPEIADFSAEPDFVSGSGTQEDPYVISPETVSRNGEITSEQTITVSNQTAGRIMVFGNQTTPSGVKPKFHNDTGVVSNEGNFSFNLDYNDGSGATTTEESVYVGKPYLGHCHFSWTITQEV